MASRTHHKTINELYEKLFGWQGVAIALFLLIIGNFVDHLSNSIGFLFKEIGIAIFILVGLALTLEKRHRASFENEVKALIEDFKKNSFTALFDWLIPQVFLQEVENQIFRQGFIRRKCELEYRLRPIDDEIRDEVDEGCDYKDSLYMIQTFKYTLINNKSVEQEYILNGFIEKEDAPNFNSLAYVRILSENLPTIYDKDQLKNYLITDKRSNKYEINKMYSIPKIMVNPNSSIEIEMRFRAIRSYKTNREFFSSMIPTEDLKVIVNNTLENLDIRAESFSASDLTVIDAGQIPLKCNPQEKCWKTTGPLLPHQGVMVWWNKYFTTEPDDTCPIENPTQQ